MIRELRNLLDVLDATKWHRDGTTGRRIKRLHITEDAIARIRKAVGENAMSDDQDAAQKLKAESERESRI